MSGHGREFRDCSWGAGRWLRRDTVFTSVLGVYLSVYVVIVRPVEQRDQWYKDVEYRILRLAEKPPADLSGAQWASCIGWTWNLHTNWGPAPDFDAAERDRFLAEFEQRLEGERNLGTIDWIWDQYCRYTQGGKSYSKSFRPTTPESLKQAASNPQLNIDLEWYREEAMRRGPRQ